jgi:tetratricopeptide (TPR) repeat protein
LLLYNRGREDSARAVLEQLRRGRSPLYRGMGANGLANLALLHGRLGEWKALRAEVSAANEARGAPEPPLLDSMVAARLIAWFLEAPARGTRLLDSALAGEPPPTLQSSRPGPSGGLQPTYLDAATFYALAGEPQRARAWLARYDARVRDSALRRLFEPRRHNALAELALAEGRPLDAVRELRLGDSLPDGPANDCARCVYVQLGRAYDLANVPDSAIALFERFVATPFIGRLAGDAWYLAGVHKRLGELYGARGDRARAAANYAKFVELWNDADPELQPKVAAVRRRLAELGDAERR